MHHKLRWQTLAIIGTLALAGGANAGVITEGSLITNLQSSDLSSSSATWVNEATGADSVGNFTTNGGGNLNVTTVTYNSQSYNALNVAGNGANAVISANNIPAAISGNGPLSLEAWIDPTTVTSGINTVMGFGYGANRNQSSEYSFSNAGPFHGQFNDASWNGYTPTTGLQYVAWVYEPGVATGTSANTLLVYVNGTLVDTAGLGNLNNQVTNMGVGTFNNASSVPVTSWGRDTFQGSIAALRVETGQLTAADIANNYSAGPGGVVPEPATVALAGIGLCGLLVRRRARRAT